MQGKFAANSRSGNSYVAWREVTPWHNKLIEAMLQSPCHIIATMRSKTDYIQTETETGRKEIKKVGLAPVQREGMDYKFTTVFDLQGGNHIATVSKDRTGIFDNQYFTITKQTGETLRDWLNRGYDLQRTKNIFERYVIAFDGQKSQALAAIKEIIGDTPSTQITDEQFELLENKLLQLERKDETQSAITEDAETSV